MYVLLFLSNRGLVSWRYFEDDMQGLFQIHDLPRVTKFIFRHCRGFLRQQLYGQGLGRHSFEEIHTLMKLDLEALSTYLGKESKSSGFVYCSCFELIIIIVKLFIIFNLINYNQ